MEKCLKIHKLVFYGNQQFEEEHRPIEHSNKKEKEKLKCRTLIETNIQGEPKYRDKKGNKYPDIESFQNRTSLPEIEIRESLKKKGRAIKVRATKQAMRRKKKKKKTQKGGKRKL